MISHHWAQKTNPASCTFTAQSGARTLYSLPFLDNFRYLTINCSTQTISRTETPMSYICTIKQVSHQLHVLLKLQHASLWHLECHIQDNFHHSRKFHLTALCQNHLIKWPQVAATSSISQCSSLDLARKHYKLFPKSESKLLKNKRLCNYLARMYPRLTAQLQGLWILITVITTISNTSPDEKTYWMCKNFSIYF